MKRFFLVFLVVLACVASCFSAVPLAHQDENNAGAWNRKGEESSKSGNYDEAIAAFKRALKIRPEYFDALMNLGAAYQHSGHIDDAIDSYKAASKVRPESEFPHWFLGNAYASSGQYKKAIADFIEVTLINPECQYLLGWAYSKAGHHKESIEPLKRAIELKPSYALAHFRLGLAYHSVGDKASALEQHRILTTLDAELAKKLYDNITSARLTDR